MFNSQYSHLLGASSATHYQRAERLLYEYQHSRSPGWECAVAVYIKCPELTRMPWTIRAILKTVPLQADLSNRTSFFAISNTQKVRRAFPPVLLSFCGGAQHLEWELDIFSSSLNIIQFWNALRCVWKSRHDNGRRHLVCHWPYFIYEWIKCEPEDRVKRERAPQSGYLLK